MKKASQKIPAKLLMKVIQLGFEPRAHGLKGRCSTN